jgi:hypothetical protein
LILNFFFLNVVPSPIRDLSAGDLACLLNLILDGSRGDAIASNRLQCTQSLCEFAVETLGRQVLNSRLPLLLPREISHVAHKTGTSTHLPGTVADAGLVLRNGDPEFILCVLVHNPTNENYGKAQLFIAELCKYFWDKNKQNSAMMTSLEDKCLQLDICQVSQN